MKTDPAGARRARLGIAALVASFLGYGPASLFADPAAVPAIPGEPKTHALFVGADLLVEQDKVFHRVEDVVGGSFVIKVNGREVKVPANWGAIKLKVERQMRVTGASAEVENLAIERGYTPENDPVKKFMHRQGEEMAAHDAEMTLVVQLEQARVMTRVGGGAIIPGLTGNPVALEQKLNRQSGASLASFGNTVSAVGQMQDDLRRAEYDAINVTFDVSSRMALRKPYVVVMAQFHPADAKPGETQNWLYAAELDPIDPGATAQKIRVRKGGFPPGYILEKYQVHVYDSGQEIASNAAEKQVAMTKQEAFAFLLLDYAGTHKGASLPAAPALGKPSPADATRLGPEPWRRTYFVKVAKDGMPGPAFLDANLTTPVGEAVAPLISGVRFYPALENGRPVDGVAELKFSRVPL